MIHRNGTLGLLTTTYGALGGLVRAEDREVVRRELEFAHPAEEEGIAGKQFLSVEH